MSIFQGILSFFTRKHKMNQYSMLLTSQEYADFIRENQAYAELMGYNVAITRGLTEAMGDQFLFREFLKEVETV